MNSPILAAPLVLPNTTTVKRVSSIKLHNFRAYYGEYLPIQLNAGENMLIYGENGSGKSSLFKALNNYLESSRNANQIFTKNRLSSNESGEIVISFKDFDTTTSTEIIGPAQNFTFSDVNSNNTAQFIQDACLVKGFLDYTSLLDVYFHREAEPNLFKLIVLSLLGDHIPISSGGNFKFKTKWHQLQADLTKNAWTRNDSCHRMALQELPTFETHLRHTLSDIFFELNRYLKEYFTDLNIELDFKLKKLDFNYKGGKPDWYTTADLRLVVKKDGILIVGDYGDILNEARLSACAICLYLASVRKNPTNVDLKLLYLDDIFIGLDAGNRIPILKIIQNEFSDFQIFISTYDRHLFELGKQHFETFVPSKWLFTELYVSKGIINNVTFDIPLIIQKESDFSRAVFYLHHPIKPDYPASANYFRKFAEGILQTHIPPHEIRDSDFSLIANYRLSHLVNAAIKFYEKIDVRLDLLLQLQNALPTLLHPLSHFNLSAPIYKNELVDIQTCLFCMEKELKELKLKFKPFIPQSKLVKLKIPLAPQQMGYYEIQIQEMIYILLDKSGLPNLSNGECKAKCHYIIQDGMKRESHNCSSNNVNFRYSSLKDAFDKIYLHLSTNPKYATVVKAAKFTTEFEINEQGIWQSLAPLLAFE